MATKSTFVKAFNSLLTSLLDDIQTIFPQNDEIQLAKSTFESVLKLNATAIIRSWYSLVYSKYADRIDSGDISFFIDKDYGSDLDNVAQSEQINVMINKLRDPIRSMDDTNKGHTMDYIQKLSKLSVAYNQ